MTSYATVTVTVKCPAIINEATRDYDLQGTSTQTVADLRQQISRHHPCRPLPLDQRLIFRGHLLNDDTQTLYGLCQQNQSSNLVIHMVLRSGNYGKVIPSMSSFPTQREEKSVMTSPKTSDKEKEPLPLHRYPLRRRRSYYQIVNDHGQIVYADISNALLFDGRQFYVMRGAHPLLANSPLPCTMPELSSTLMPLSMRAATIITPPSQRQHRDMSTESPAHDPAPAALDALPAREGERARHVIRIDIAAIFSFLLRFAIVILIFSQGKNKLRLVTLSILFGFIFLYQAGFFNFLGLSNFLRQLWDPIIRIRQHPAPIGNEAREQGDEEGEQREGDVNIQEERAQQRREAAPQPDQPGVLYKLLEVITTFWLSMFPTPPPVIPGPVDQVPGPRDQVPGPADQVPAQPAAVAVGNNGY